MTSRDFPLVSVIIVNFNGRHHLGECLGSLQESDYPREKVEVIFVDNASRDGSAEFVKETFPRVKVIELDKNSGFCGPNNVGARAAQGEHLVFLNNDTVVMKNWITELVQGALSDTDVVSCASKMLYYDRKDVINTAGGKITIIGGGFYRGYGDRATAAYDNFEYTGFGCGAGVLVKREFFLSSGGFDEDYFAACEEHDLGWRVWLFGHKVLYVPTAVMYHKESGTFGSKSSFQSFKVYLITRNRLFNLYKNFEAKNVLKGFFISLGFDIYRSSKHLMHGNGSAVASILRGYRDFWRSREKTLRKRKFVQDRRKRSDKELYELGVIATLRESISEEKRLTRVWRSDFYRL